MNNTYLWEALPSVLLLHSRERVVRPFATNNTTHHTAYERMRDNADDHMNWNAPAPKANSTRLQRRQVKRTSSDRTLTQFGVSCSDIPMRGHVQ